MVPDVRVLCRSAMFVCVSLIWLWRIESFSFQTTSKSNIPAAHSLLHIGMERMYKDYTRTRPSRFLSTFSNTLLRFMDSSSERV